MLTKDEVVHEVIPVHAAVKVRVPAESIRRFVKVNTPAEEVP